MGCKAPNSANRSQDDVFDAGFVELVVGIQLRRRAIRAKVSRIPTLSHAGTDKADASAPVSYTHLTLPTILLV